VIDAMMFCSFFSITAPSPGDDCSSVDLAVDYFGLAIN
jgi:hypothetical protein